MQEEKRFPKKERHGARDEDFEKSPSWVQLCFGTAESEKETKITSKEHSSAVEPVLLRLG